MRMSIRTEKGSADSSGADSNSGADAGSSAAVAEAVVAEGVSVTIGSRVALSGVNLTVPAGSSVAVIGPNGSGKSTFLRALAGLGDVSGQLTVDAASHDAGVAMVFQDAGVDPHLPMTVGEAVSLGRYPTTGWLGRFSKLDHQIVGDSIRRMDTEDLVNEQLSALSGGQRQRALVAQGLAQRSPLLLLDEPFTGVDVLARDRILRSIGEELADGRTVIISTHDLADAARCDLVLLLAGKQIAFGTPESVLTESHLAEAFGERVLHAVDGSVVLDDPHHHHEDHDGDARGHRGYP